MQWLTAILAFATTMLIFSIVVSAIVETIHRILGSRSFGLVSMLEHYYDDVLSGFYPNDASNRGPGPADREKFIETMIRVRAPGVSIRARPKFKDANVWQKMTQVLGLIPQGARLAYSKLSGTSEAASKVGYSGWRLLNSLPVETFMERLATAGFSDVLAARTKPEDEDQILKDIAQKFELYGQESTLYFETKARTISVVVALVVAWTFYVHPYDLIQTYMKNPAVAAQVAELSESTLEQFQLQKERLELAKQAQEKAQQAAKAAPAAAKETQETTTDDSPVDLDALLERLKKDMDDGHKQATLLATAGAPIGWPKVGEGATKVSLFCSTSEKDVGGSKKVEPKPADKSSPSEDGADDSEEIDPIPADQNCGIKMLRPTETKDIFWLLMGGLLIGLGSPFWARAISQLTRAKGAAQNLGNILKPQEQTAQVATQVTVASDEERKVPLTTLAFRAADASRSVSKQSRPDAS